MRHRQKPMVVVRNKSGMNQAGSDDITVIAWFAIIVPFNIGGMSVHETSPDMLVMSSLNGMLTRHIATYGTRSDLTSCIT